jgi:hypothetical protein
MPKNVDGTVWLIEQTHRAERKAIQCALDGIVRTEGTEPSADKLESYHRYWDRVAANLARRFLVPDRLLHPNLPL